MNKDKTNKEDHLENDVMKNSQLLCMPESAENQWIFFIKRKGREKKKTTRPHKKVNNSTSTAIIKLTCFHGAASSIIISFTFIADSEIQGLNGAHKHETAQGLSP